MEKKNKWKKIKVLKPHLEHCTRFWGSGTRLALLTTSKSMKGGDEAEAQGDEDRLRKQGLSSLQK